MCLNPLACSDEWVTQFATHMQHPEHITLLEARGTMQAIRHKLRTSKNFGMRHLHLGDNLGMVLAYDRGRAKSVPLLICCRKAAAYSVAGNCFFTHRWIPSEWNAADGPSRQWESSSKEFFSKRKAKEIQQAICYPKGQSQAIKEVSSPGLLAQLKKNVPPRRTKSAPSQKELRKAIQGKDEITRATKRKNLADQKLIVPRSAEQTMLEAAAVAPRTSEEYNHKLKLFQSFCSVQKLRLQKPTDVDLALTLFLNQSFIEGWSVAEGNKCLAAVMDWKPQISKHQLPRSRRSLQGWKNLDPGTTRPPMAWPLIALIALVMVEAGNLIEALAILLMFVIYARPGEVFSIRRKDLVGSSSLGMDWAVNLHSSEELEASKVDATNETLLLNNQEVPWLGSALSCLAPTPEAALIPSSYQSVQLAWTTAQHKLRLKDKAVLYQLRHSGAS